MRFILIFIILLQCLSGAEAGNFPLRGIKTVRLAYGLVDRDFADQNSALAMIALQMGGEGLEVETKPIGEKLNINPNCSALFSFKCWEPDEARGLVVTNMQLQVYTRGTTEYGSYGLICVYSDSVLGTGGVDRLKNTTQAPLMKDMIAKFLEAYRKDNQP